MSSWVMFIKSIITITVLVNIIGPSFADEILLKSEVLLTVENQLPIHPSAIATTRDGGLIVVGSAGMAAWARKVNTQGKTLWEYTSDFRDKARIAHEGTFRGIAEMSDGSVFLCGNMPSPPGMYPTGLLAHLNASGQRIDEHLIAPQNAAEQGATYLSDCMRWDDGVAIVAKVSKWVKNGTTLSTLYWLPLLDSTGKVKQEKWVTPLTENFNPDIRGTVFFADGRNLFFSMTDSFNTELLSLSAVGEVRAHKRLVGRFQFVRPVKPDGLFEIYGSFTSKSQQPPVTVMLNDKFEEIKKTQGNHPANFASWLVFRLPDQSLVFFGSSVHSYGESLRSGIILVDRSLQEERSLSLEKIGFLDAGTIWAAAPTQKPGEFVTATFLAKNGQLDITSNDIFARGAVLNFIQIGD